jgi:hypothetical protein
MLQRFGNVESILISMPSPCLPFRKTYSGLEQYFDAMDVFKEHHINDSSLGALVSLPAGLVTLVCLCAHDRYYLPADEPEAGAAKNTPEEDTKSSEGPPESLAMEPVWSPVSKFTEAVQLDELAPLKEGDEKESMGDRAAPVLNLRNPLVGQDSVCAAADLD